MRRILIPVLLVVSCVYLIIEWDWRGALAERASEAALEQMEPTWQLSPARVADELSLLDDAARRAWAYADEFYSPVTGFVRPVGNYDAATIWDVASGLAALHCAYLLRLVDSATYDRRMRRALTSLERIALFDETAFNKAYLVGNGSLADRDALQSPTGYGWSAIDLGRLLIWLKIIATHSPTYAASAERIVARLRMDRIVAGQELRGGEGRADGGSYTFQEGRIGYEQYAARGFEMWGLTVGRALDWTAHTEPRAVFEQAVLSDRRPHGCLTSEPFVLNGIELGWSEDAYRLALGVLGAQRARFEATGEITLVSEDASSAAPHYFYYYCVDLDGEPFAVTAQGVGFLPDGPRAVSTKAAFAWYALSPNAYTKQVLEAVRVFLATQPGLPAGMLELGAESGPAAPRTASGPANINTAAVVLEAALYARVNGPLLGLDPVSMTAR